MPFGGWHIHEEQFFMMQLRFLISVQDKKAIWHKKIMTINCSGEAASPNTFLCIDITTKFMASIMQHKNQMREVRVLRNIKLFGNGHTVG